MTITVAVADAQNGDIIQVQAGTYPNEYISYPKEHSFTRYRRKGRDSIDWFDFEWQSYFYHERGYHN
jgi:hypothetical protein